MCSKRAGTSLIHAFWDMQFLVSAPCIISKADTTVFELQFLKCRATRLPGNEGCKNPEQIESLHAFYTTGCCCRTMMGYQLCSRGISCSFPWEVGVCLVNVVTTDTLKGNSLSKQTQSLGKILYEFFFSADCNTNLQISTNSLLYS